MKYALLILNLFICLVTFTQEVDPANPSTLFKEESDFELTDDQKQIFRNGLEKLTQNDYLGVILDMTNLINLENRCLSAYHLRGQAFLLLKEYNKSINDFSYIIDNVTPKYEDELLLQTHAARGGAFFMKKEYDKAIIDVTYAINSSYKYGATEEARLYFYRLRGSMYFDLNKKQESCLDLKIASSGGNKEAISLYNEKCLSTSNSFSAERNNNSNNSSTYSNAGSFKFEKPILNITWVDNRKVCCCCNTNMRKYRNAKIDKKESEELQYIMKNLYVYHKNNNSNESIINADLSRLQTFVSNNLTAIAGFTIPSMYTFTRVAFENVPGYKVVSKNVRLDIYEELNKKCGKCKYDCLDDSDCK